MSSIHLNTRFRRRAQPSGVDRYAAELADVHPFNELVPPQWAARGLPGLLWEQFVLPMRARGGPLVSPCNTGPIIKRRQLVVIHDGAALIQPHWFRRSYVLKQRVFLRMLARRAALVATVTEASRVELAQVLKRDLVVLPNAPRMPTVAGSSSVVGALDPYRYFLLVGNDDPRKDFATAIRAWQRSALAADGFVLVHAGGVSSAHRAVGDVSSHPDVLSLRRVDDHELAWLLANAAAVVVPSVFEGFGRPAVEAQLVGTPVVASEIPSLREACGNAAVYFPPGDSEVLADALRTVAVDPGIRNLLSSAGRINAQRWTSDVLARRLEEALRPLVPYVTPDPTANAIDVTRTRRPT